MAVVNVFGPYQFGTHIIWDTPLSASHQHAPISIQIGQLQWPTKMLNISHIIKNARLKTARFRDKCPLPTAVLHKANCHKRYVKSNVKKVEKWYFTTTTRDQLQ